MKKFLKIVLCIFKCLFLSILIGTLIAGYQYLAHEVIHLSETLLQKDIPTMIITILITVGLCVALIKLNKKFKGGLGSGIPQLEAYHAGWFKLNALPMFIMIPINSLFAFFGAFLLGSEGPSISIGSSSAKLVNDITKDEDKEIVAGAGSAAFCCAFASPLAGIAHLIEENHKYLKDPFFYIKSISIIIFSFIVSYLIYPHNLLPYFESSMLPIKYYLYFFLLVLVAFIVGRLYTYSIVLIKKLSNKANFMEYTTPVLLVIFMFLRAYIPYLSGSGSAMFDLKIIDLGLVMLVISLLIRIVGTAFSVSSHTSGGIVLPMLAVGALTGYLTVSLCSVFDEGILAYTSIFVVCGMMIVFAVVTKCSLTAFVLGLKCMDISVIILPLIISLLIVYLVMKKIIKFDTIYHQLEKLLPGFNEYHEEYYKGREKKIHNH